MNMRTEEEVSETHSAGSCTGEEVKQSVDARPAMLNLPYLDRLYSFNSSFQTEVALQDLSIPT